MEQLQARQQSTHFVQLLSSRQLPTVYPYSLYVEVVFDYKYRQPNSLPDPSQERIDNTRSYQHPARKALANEYPRQFPAIPR